MHYYLSNATTRRFLAQLEASESCFEIWSLNDFEVFNYTILFLKWFCNLGSNRPLCFYICSFPLKKGYYYVSRSFPIIGSMISRKKCTMNCWKFVTSKRAYNFQFLKNCPELIMRFSFVSNTAICSRRVVLQVRKGLNTKFHLTTCTATLENSNAFLKKVTLAVYALLEVTASIEN